MKGTGENVNMGKECPFMKRHSHKSHIVKTPSWTMSAFARSDCELPTRVRKKVVLPKTFLVSVLLQFLLTFAQGQGHGVESGQIPVGEKAKFSIPEGQSQGTFVGKIKTEAGLNYKFSQPPREFTLNSQTGEIRTAIIIDRESLSQDSFELFIQSFPSARHIIEVTIVILDVNDNNPTFGQPLINISFSENDKPGTQIILDTAMDKDINSNGITDEYRIVSGNEFQRFQLVLLKDTSEPLLYLENKVKLDREEKDSYRLNISAQDGGVPPRFGFLIVNINIRDANDNPPIFDHSDYFASINETTPIDSSIIQVRATDLDSGSNADITYKILNDDFNQFTIDPKTGILSTIKKLNCRPACEDASNVECQKRTCFVTVEASDNGTPTPQRSQAYVTVTLVDENDHDPVISFQFPLSQSDLSYAVVDESAQPNTLVAVISVTDNDMGVNGQTSIEIIKGNELGSFELQSLFSQYILVVAGKIDREIVSYYNLTIVAHDEGVPRRSSVAYLKIYVNDINDHKPTFERSVYPSKLSEYAPIGSFVAALTASDDDTGINAQITYSIISGNERGWFKIDQATGLVTTRSELDHEVQSSVVMTIKARDGASKPQSSLTNLTVEVLDENDNIPSFKEDEYLLELQEEGESGRVILTLQASDHDQGKNGSVFYRMSKKVERDYPNMFAVTRTITGEAQIKILKKLDREEYADISFPLYAIDQGTPPNTGSTMIRITVTDINDNDPVFFPQSYYQIVNEQSPESTQIIQVSATDADAEINGKVSYSIAEGGDGKFRVDAQTGWLMNTQKLVKKDKSYYSIKIAARDGANRQSPRLATVEIFVADGTEVRPRFTQPNGYSFIITEDVGTAVPTTKRQVGTVTATVASEGISYAIIDGDANDVFDIDSSGAISSSSNIDREVKSLYSLTVVAKTTNIFASVVVNVIVRDVNDNAPSIMLDTTDISIPENLPVGHDILLVKAQDLDDNENAKLQFSMGGESSSLFDIDRDTGMLLVAKPISLSSERTPSVRVIVSDSARPQLSTSVTLTLRIVDVNDHTPIFNQTSYELTFSENILINTQVLSVSAIDADYGENGNVAYEIVKGNFGSVFGIFPNGILYVAKDLDRESRDLYVLTLRAFDRGQNPRSSLVNVTVHVNDINDNAPVFSNSTYEMELKEGEAPQSYVGTIYASDKDSGRNAELQYTFKGDHYGFSIHSKSGVITNTEVFDRERLIAESRKDHVGLTVVATDGAVEPKSEECTVKVFITDINDSEPVFDNLIYSASVYENAAIDSQINRVSASDADDGKNGEVQYSILSGNDAKTFEIDSNTGSLVLKKELDRETKDHFMLVVMAIDQGNPQLNSTTEIYITVLDDNDNAPQFHPVETTYVVNENERKGKVITEVHAYDLDLGNNADITYSIGETNSPFAINSVSGKISLRGDLDFEMKSQYTLTVIATDAGTTPLSSSISLTVNILDNNDNSPQFPAGEIVRQITENVDVDTQVVTVQAVDADSGLNGQLVYSIKDQDPPGNHFKIESQTGVIRTQKSIDREFADNFELTIVATDQAVPASTRKSSEKLVTVFVSDVNDNTPKFVSPNTAVVDINAMPNTKITDIVATDSDIDGNGRVTYEIFSGNTDIFRIDANTGALFLKATLPSSPMSFDMSIKAKDQGSPEKSTYMNMKVFATSDTENGPSFTQASYVGEVYENEPKDKSILTVTAAYANDRGAPIEYYITAIKSGGVDTPRFFQINAISGLLSTVEPLDRELGYSTFTVDVYAFDLRSSSRKSSRVTVDIYLLDLNDCAPEFQIQDDPILIPENARFGTVVTILSVTDADQQGSVKYAIVSGGFDKFGINITSGVVTVAGPLDRETRERYYLEVSANDGEHVSSATLEVTIADVNDMPPLFTSEWYSFDVTEDTQTGLAIGMVHAEDADTGANAQVTYSMLSHWGRDKFSLDPASGILRLIGALDFEQTEYYMLLVAAQDGGSAAQLSSSCSVYVNVVDVNDNAPVFDLSSYRAEVSENATTGTSVLTTTATDIDAGVASEVRYSIIEGNIAQKFVIDDKSGVISIESELDRETQLRYVLSIRAEDQAPRHPLSSTALVTIDVLDVNDNAPEFESSDHFTIMENTPIGSSVFKVIATDADENGNGKVEYSIVSSTEDALTIGKEDGVMKLTKELDRETLGEFDVTVRASDKGKPMRHTNMFIQVIVGDANDHEPVFEPAYYTEELEENVLVGTSILTVTATDMDIGVNGDIRYLITEGDDNKDFYLNAHTGELNVQKALDYERRKKYELVITGQDLGEPTKTDVATVVITVTDINDCPPVFLDSPYFVYVQENIEVLPVYVATVSAIDSDSGVRGQVAYSISEGNTDKFAINVSTGVIHARATLDREEQAEYTLTLQAIDRGFPRLGGFGLIHITVGDANDNSPRFGHDHYNGAVMENEPAGSEVMQVTATDRDTGRNAQLRYWLMTEESVPFGIDPRTGVISTLAPLDRESVGEYRLVVGAADGGGLPRTATAVVTVTVGDANDHAPAFLQAAYTGALRDNTQPGVFVVGVTAVDRDQDKNGEIRYSLSGDSGSLTIDAVTGIITARQPLTAAGGEIAVTVVASDQGDPSKQTSTQVRVTFLPSSTESSNFPEFYDTQQNFQISETAALNSLITKAKARSQKSNAVLSFHIVGGNLFDSFNISSSGEVRIKNPLDYESVKKYTLWLSVRDDSTQPILSDFIKLNINLVDENDFVPKFEKLYYNATVLEGEFPPVKVATVSAIDLDSNDNGRISYRLVHGNIDNSFDIEERTGEISTMAFLDRETVDHYTLVVEAVDNGAQQNTATATIDVIVTDKNDNFPSFTQHLIARLTENAPNGTFVTKITSSDADIGENAVHVYSLSTVAYKDLFHVDPHTGDVIVIGKLDREEIDQYRLSVSVNDESHNVETQISIDILDANDNPPTFSQNQYNFIIVEHQQSGIPVGKVFANDRDAKGPNSDIFYMIKPSSGYFSMATDTGVITTRQAFDFKMVDGKSSPENVHKLTVVASDRGEPPLYTETQVVVTVVQENLNQPMFSQKVFSAAVSDDATIGYSITNVTAVDKDLGANGELTYTIERFNGTSSLFFIDPNTGVITVASYLGQLTGRIYNLIIKAEDKGQPPKNSTTSVIITIVPVNRYVPRFTGTTFHVSVPENQLLGSTLLKISAVDEDQGSNGVVHYFISNGDPENVFGIDESQGDLKLVKRLDFEKQNFYTLEITVKDGGLLPNFNKRSVTVNVTNVNDVPPRFSSQKYHAYVKENSMPSTSVFTLQANDEDSNMIGYYITGDSFASDTFKVNSNTGLISTVREIDYEQKSVYEVTIQAINPGTSLSATTIIQVQVQGENEFIPKFIAREFSFVVSESASLGQSIGQVEATDQDKGQDGDIFYYLIGDSNSKGFSVNDKSGDISIEGPIDREATSEIVLDVMAKNSGPIYGNNTDICKVRVIVRDANDPPAFEKYLYESRVSEGANIGTSVVQVLAIDKDLQPEFSTFEYSILRGNDGGNFAISRVTGWITTSKVLDREAAPVYNLVIAATDNGTPAKTGSTNVKIHIDDINDNSPFFKPSVPVVYFKENQPPSSEMGSNLNLFTEDADLDPNRAPYKYRLLNHNDTFDIGIDSGRVQTKVELDREAISKYSVKVQVGDNGNPVMTSTLTFDVEVQDENDNPSSERPLKVIVYAYNNQFARKKVADVKPSDVDLVGDYACSIIGGDESFTISEECNLKSLIAAGPKDEYSLEISGSDGVHRPVSYPVNIFFYSFDESTISTSHTIILNLNEITTALFLEKHYDRFLNVLDDLIPNTSKLHLYSMRDQIQIDGSVNALLLVAVIEQNGEYLMKNQLAQIITTSKSQIEIQSGVNIETINYNPCSNTICANRAECTYTLERQNDEYTYHASESVAFTSPKIMLSTTCICRKGFMGATCNETVNKCQGNPCKNGGYCNMTSAGFQCHCPQSWTGSTCEVDVNECVIANPCKNGATCNNVVGSYTCTCPPLYQGVNCQLSVDPCKSQPCANGGSCVSQGTQYTCACAFGFYGNDCEMTSRGFSHVSFEEYEQELDENRNTIHLEIATLKRDALLFYYRMSAEEFMAIQVINGQVDFSFALGDGIITRLILQSYVSDGQWWRIMAERNGRVGTLQVIKCENSDCPPCNNDPSCYVQETNNNGQFQILDVGKTFFIGGIRSFDDILPYKSQISTHDFVGCMRQVEVDNINLFDVDAFDSQNTGPCERSNEGHCGVADVCSERGQCVDDWSSAFCQCADGFAGPQCEEESTGFSFGNNAFLKYTLKESFVRDQALLSSRSKRDTLAPTTLSLTFQTSKSDALLFYSTLTKPNEYVLLHIKNNKITYVAKDGGEISHDVDVNDNKWHNVSINMKEQAVIMNVDETAVQMTSASASSSATFQNIYIGGTDSPIIINGNENSISGFEGCLDHLIINGEQLPLQGPTLKYDVEVTGEVTSSCTTAPEVPTIAIVVGVVVTFFVLVIIGIVLSFIIIRIRRARKQKDKNIFNSSTSDLTPSKPNSSNHTNSGYTENGGVFIEEQIINQHIREELQGHKFSEREVCDVRPDIIGEEAPNVHQNNMVNAGMDNMGYNEEQPEHYDIDNASSIAPSDLVDVVAHYKMYRSGLLNNHKNQNYHHHHHHPTGGYRQGNPSPSTFLSQRVQNQSPANLSIASRNSPNIMGRTTPMFGSTSPLRINSISPFNHHNRNHLTPTPNSEQNNIPNISGKLSDSGSYPNNPSESSTSTILANSKVPPSAISKLKQPINQVGLRSSLTPTPILGLTVEEVNRLNARHKLSPVSTLDAMSSASDTPHRNDINKTDFTHADLLAPVAMLPEDSSSEDETNDSFTCSEFEYDHEKMRNDLHAIDHRKGIVPRLAKVDENDTDTTVSKSMHLYETDSNHESASTFFTSDEDMPITKRIGGVKNKLPNGALNWDYLLNWGPNFEKLVGVFSDIALLPDSDNDGTLKFSESGGSWRNGGGGGGGGSHQRDSQNLKPNGFPHSFSPNHQNGVKSNSSNVSQQKDLPNGHMSVSSNSIHSCHSPIPPAVANSNFIKKDIPVGSVLPNSHSPHGLSNGNDLVSTATKDDCPNESYLEEYV